jgi:hypothetical protein
MGFTHVGMCCKALRNANGVVELAHATLASGAAKKADQLTAKAAKQEKQLHKLQAKLAHKLTKAAQLRAVAPAVRLHRLSLCRVVLCVSLGAGTLPCGVDVES